MLSVTGALPFAVTQKTPSFAAGLKPARLWNMRLQYTLVLLVTFIASIVSRCNASEVAAFGHLRTLKAGNGMATAQADSIGGTINHINHLGPQKHLIPVLRRLQTLLITRMTQMGVACRSGIPGGYR